MRRIALICMQLFLSITMYAQANNFHSEDGKIYWQKIYEKELDVVSALTNAGIFTDITTVN